MDLRETLSRAHIIPILVISTFVMFLKPIPVSGQGASARRQTAEPARQECVEGVGRVHAAWTLITRAYRGFLPIDVNLREPPF